MKDKRDLIPDDLETPEGRKGALVILLFVVVMAVLAVSSVVALANVFDVQWLQSLIERLLVGVTP